MNEEIVRHELFKVPLLDLGVAENPAFAGVLSPKPELGLAREGVNKVFLEDAESYYRKYQGFDYWRMLIEQAGARLGFGDDVRCVVEFGCGFGNSTLPILDLFPQSRVVATDISPNLLAILKRLLDGRGLGDRCVAVAMDAQREYLADGVADLVVGSAILHHLADPEIFVRRAMQVLKPDGAAIFFEPFEAGNAILRLICMLVADEADRRRESSRAIKWLKTIPGTLEPQIKRENMRGWRKRDDKWAFPRTTLENIAHRCGADLVTYPLHDNQGQFTRHFTYMLEVYGGMKASDLPKWAWRIFKRFDEDLFSPDCLTDLPLESCVIFRKREMVAPQPPAAGG